MRPPGDGDLPAVARSIDRIVRRAAFALAVLAMLVIAGSAITAALAADLRRGLALTRCTPAPLRAFARRERLVVISAYRRGARVRGTRRPSLHARCDGRAGAIDVRRKPGLVRKARRAGFGVGVYCGGHNHIHLSTGGREGLFMRGCSRRKARHRRPRP